MPDQCASTDLLLALSRHRGAGLFNPWGERCQLDVGRHPAAARRTRLAAHLSLRRAHLVLVGEALGYQGGRCTGVAFTSERLVLEGAIPRIAQPGGPLSKRALPWSEPSATVVWRALRAAGLASTTVLWNACPWHPLGARGPFSNRRPTEPERRAGLPLLEQLLALCPGAVIGAVGRSAEKSLRELQRDFVPLRHPAYGGATLFADGVQAIARG